MTNSPAPIPPSAGSAVYVCENGPTPTRDGGEPLSMIGEPPNWPAMWLPQQMRVSSALIAHEWYSPAVIWVTVPMPGGSEG
jgi:hypothetical protein